MRARYYNPTTGGFIAKDPVEGILTEPQTQNGYGFVSANPINLSDPSGEDYVNVGVGGGFIVGAQAGLLIQDDGSFYPYVGVGLTTPGIGFILTGSTADPSPGKSISVSAALGGAYGGNYDLNTGSIAHEWGVGSPNLSASYQHTFNNANNICR